MSGTALDGLNALRFDDAKLQASVSAETYNAYHSSVKTGTAMADDAAQELAGILDQQSQQDGYSA